MSTTATAKRVKKVWVTAYEVSLAYGGPEEGGWNFHWYYPVETLYVPSDATEEAIKSLEERHHDDLPGGSISSVLGGYQIEIYVETKKQARATNSKPVWE